MWAKVLRPGLGLLDGTNREVRAVGQELTHFTVHDQEAVVLWVDGDHGFNPYDLAELNLVRGLSAEEGADRVLIKRCMTPFQWDTALTQHLDEKLAEVPDVGLVLALPYGRLFSTDELKPWEQVDYVRYSLQHLKELARRHQVPILLGADLHRWRVAHPELVALTEDAIEHRWSVGRTPGTGGGRRLAVPGNHPLDRWCQTSLLDFVDLCLLHAEEPVAEADPLDEALGPGDGPEDDLVLA